MQRSARSRRSDALQLADDLLADIELSRIPPQDIARKAYRLARLLDDAEAMAWLQHEVRGYPTPVTPEAWEAADRSNRTYRDSAGTARANVESLGQLQAAHESALAQMAASADPPVSIQSANPRQIVKAPEGSHLVRSRLRNMATESKATADKVTGAIHTYVVERHQELRFGSAVESAFEVVRADVDARFGRLVPEGPAKLAAAFENAASDNPEHWANAAATCRRLLKATADGLRPPGEPVKGRDMGDRQYINRLIDWIVNRAESETAADMFTADLEYLGRRLDAADSAGHKGAHAEVDRFDASRFLVDTYLLLGDILGLAGEGPTRDAAASPEDTGDLPPPSVGGD